MYFDLMFLKFYDLLLFFFCNFLTGMGLVSSPFASMNPFALPTCNSQSYGASPLVGTTK